MRSGRPIRARGAALLIMLAIIALGASWFLVRQLNAETGSITAQRKLRDAQVLNRAKQALIGYVASQAANSGEDNPGALPCPEAAGYFDNPGQEGQTASGCTLPKVGRFPWRTIGTEKLVDSSGEPLWYVVSPGWAATSSGFKTNINSNTLGQLTVDGAANAAVALIIAPGAALSVPACGTNPAISQTRPTAGTPDWRNYLECENATHPTPDATFVTTGPAGAFNDQVVRVTVAELMPAIEAAVAKRIERDIVPSLKAVYASTQWGSGISATNPLFAYPAPFGDPGTSNFQGAAVTVAGAPQGLLPFNQTQGCDPTTDARCTTTLTAWASTIPPDVIQTGGYGSFQTKTCSWQSSGEDAYCEGQYLEDSSNPTGSGMVISMTATINNVAMGLRVLDATKATIEAEDDYLTGTLTTITPSIAATMNSNGSVTITISGTLPNIDDMGWGSFANYRIRLKRSVIGDHPLLNSNASTTGWFVRNEWYRLLYYAVAPTHTAAQIPGTLACTTGVSCLSVTNMTQPDNKRTLMLLAGRSLGGATRPNGTLSDFVEFSNSDGDTAFEKQPISTAFNAAAKKPFNDRVIVLDSN